MVRLTSRLGLALHDSRLKAWLGRALYGASLALVHPTNCLLAKLLPDRRRPRSVLHVSYMVHVPWHVTRALRRQGWQADFLAVGESPHWNCCDYQMPKTNPVTAAWRELWLFWTVMARYEVVHFHFMMTMTRSGWEVPLLKRMGRTVVAHFRGCEARNRDRNMELHPSLNICEQCDYDPPICLSPVSEHRRSLAARWADATLVTTPDMLDFLPTAVVSSFFVPADVTPDYDRPPWDGKRTLRLLHVTNHPGIEGTERILEAVEGVRAQGFKIEFVHLKDVSHSTVMQALREADMAIGKMKMGFYANSQIESMACGVPTITWIRPEFMTERLRESGFIICHLDQLEATLISYLSNPEALRQKREIAKASILGLHDEDSLARKLLDTYVAHA